MMVIALKTAKCKGMNSKITKELKMLNHIREITKLVYKVYF